MKTYISISIPILFLMAFVSGAQSQQVEWNDKMTEIVFDKSTFIFEGEIIKSEEYDNYTSNIVKIVKIFRGADSIKLGTIEVVTMGGKNTNIEDMKIWGKTGSGIYFCHNHSPQKVKTDNEIRVSPIEIVSCFRMENWYEPNSEIRKKIGYGFKAFGKIFSSKEEFYQFLSQYPNITIPTEEEKK